MRSENNQCIMKLGQDYIERSVYNGKIQKLKIKHENFVNKEIDSISSKYEVKINLLREKYQKLIIEV